MRYWNSKFMNLNPHPLPLDMPSDALTLAKLAIKQITSVDPTTDIQIYETQENSDESWIVSGMSVKQKRLLEKWPHVSVIFEHFM